MEVVNQLLTVEFALVAVSIFVLIFTLRKVFPEFFAKKKVKRFLPLAPMVLGILFMALIPGLSSFTHVGARIMHGAIAGFVAAYFRKVGKQSFLEPILEAKNGKRKVVDKS